MTRPPRLTGTLRLLGAWLTPWSHGFRVRASQSGLEFYAHHHDVIGRHLAKYGSHEPELTAWIARYLAQAKPGLFIDIGANLGWHVVHAAQHRSVETIVAFEPDPFNGWLLNRNLTLNKIDKAVVSNNAVGDRSGVARLHSYKASNRGRHSLLKDYGLGSLNVPLTDLDSALKQLGLGERRVSLIKIDVEGYEPAVIAGATQTLARTDALVLEFSPQLSGDGALSTRHMTEALRGMGFAPFRLQGSDIIRLDAAQLSRIQQQCDLIWLRS